MNLIVRIKFKKKTVFIVMNIDWWRDNEWIYFLFYFFNNNNLAKSERKSSYFLIQLLVQKIRLTKWKVIIWLYHKQLEAHYSHVFFLYEIIIQCDWTHLLIWAHHKTDLTFGLNANRLVTTSYDTVGRINFILI